MLNTYQNTYDEKYFNNFTTGYSPYSDLDLKNIFKILIPKIPDASNLNICEVGCASGQFSIELEQRLKKSEPNLYGVDIAKDILELYPFNKINASAFNIPIENNFFDLICFQASLHHMFPFEKVVAESNRLLKNGGLFYCLEPNYFHPHRYFLMRFKYLYNLFVKINDTPINPNKLKKCLLANNYKILYFQYINIFFSTDSLFQKIQNSYSKTYFANKIPKYSLPWFITIAQKS